MGTNKATMLGRTQVTVPYQCCNDPFIEKNIARRRENRQWKSEAEEELWRWRKSE